MKFGLENISRLCDGLGHPERSFQAVLVAGTNGKGSVTVMVETALRAAGHRTARYTSPHLTRLEERFVIDGADTSTGALRAAAARVQAIVLAGLGDGTFEAPPTFFECTTAAAFELFRDAAVEVAVLEVGLGGRLDATNIVSPAVTAITSIDLDHQAQLGDTVADIAREKAGIVRAGIPVVCGPLPAAADAVIRGICHERGAPLVRAAGAVQTVVRTTDDDRVRLDVRTSRRRLDDVTLSLRGRHQIDNAAVAVCVLDELDARDVRVDDHSVRAGLAGAVWPGRLERLDAGGHQILVDAAHNPAGARALASYLRETGWTSVTLVFGVMEDKDTRGMLQALVPLCEAVVCTTAPTARAMAAPDLAVVVRQLAGPGVRVEVIDDPMAALGFARGLRRRVVIAGSIFLIGLLRDSLR